MHISSEKDITKNPHFFSLNLTSIYASSVHALLIFMELGQWKDDTDDLKFWVWIVLHAYYSSHIVKEIELEPTKISMKFNLN